MMIINEIIDQNQSIVLMKFIK